MNTPSSDLKMLSKLMFKLLPIQILLGAVGSVNGIVSTFFASNYVGIDAMSAVGLYAPVNMLIGAIALTLMGGSVILCGKYMGKNAQDKMQQVFSLDLIISIIIAAIFIALFLILCVFDLTFIFTGDPAVRPLFNRYLLGQAIGLVPFILGNQFSAYLSMENKGHITTIASLIYIAAGVLFNFIFVRLFHMEAFGLALAGSLGLWVFLLFQAHYFLTGRSHLRIAFRGFDFKETLEIIRIGIPSGLSNGYQTARGLIVNWLLEIFIGTVGISAFAAANNLMSIFWSIPAGMLAVSRMMISVSVGEEDRQTLADVMRVMFRRFIPLQCVVSACIILCSVPLTRLFFRDPAEPVYMMTVWGLRLLPLCMPFSIICMHFVCYAQTSGKTLLVHILSILDGVVCVAGFTAILIRFMGMNSVYIANILNGVTTTIVVIGYSWLKRKRMPRNMEELMVIPDDFGAEADARMDITIKNMEEVVTISQQVQAFCRSRGLDERRSFLSALAMEEMAGNIVDHGFTKDTKKHTVDVRVVHKDDDLILRLKDDCIPFDPAERLKITGGDDITRNIGIRMIYKIARNVQYQNILGLNVLTIRI